MATLGSILAGFGLLAVSVLMVSVIVNDLTPGGAS